MQAADGGNQSKPPPHDVYEPQQWQVCQDIPKDAMVVPSWQWPTAMWFDNIFIYVTPYLCNLMTAVEI